MLQNLGSKIFNLNVPRTLGLSSKPMLTRVESSWWRHKAPSGFNSFVRPRYKLPLINAHPWLPTMCLYRGSTVFAIITTGRIGQKDTVFALIASYVATLTMCFDPWARLFTPTTLTTSWQQYLLASIANVFNRICMVQNDPWCKRTVTGTDPQ